MAGTSNAPLSRTSASPTDSQFHSEPPYSGSNPSGSPHLSVGRLAGAFLSGSGRAPLTANGGAAPPQTDCKMVEVHGAKVASFTVNGVELICLPQVFELFLKHLVGGLHTVYTKLKRLDISPVVCSVEQVRILRGLGAIQPGVNRCKLITRADFETLYRDCTNASSRPGRPPKRSLGIVAMADNSRVLPHGLISPALLSQPGLTAATMAEALALQKMRLMMGFHANSEQQWHHDADRTTSPSELDDAGASEGSWEKDQHVLAAPLSMAVAPPPGSASLRLNTLQQRSTLLANRLSDLPFMVMPHPLLPVGLPPAGVAMAMNQMSQLSGLANMAAMSHVQEEESKSLPGTPSLSPSPSDDDAHLQEPTSQSPSRASSSLLSSSPPPAPTPELDETAEQHNDAKKPRTEKDESLLPLPFNKPTYEKLPLSVTQANPALAPFLLAEGLSSMETLLTNIQGLLKVAVQSARCQDKQNQMERKELKVELDKERDARQTLQRQLSCELQTRVSIQKRLKKEKKAKRRLQEALDFESRRRQQVERALKHSDLLADAVIPDIDLENKEQENPAAQENRPFSKPPLLF